MNDKLFYIVTIYSAIFIYAARAVTLVGRDIGTDFNNTSFDWSTFHPGQEFIKTTAVPIANNTMIPVTNETAAYEMDTDGPSYASALAFAGGAINLEIVYSVAVDGFQPRFKKGMDPSSTWYKEATKSFEDSGDDPEFIYSDGTEDSYATRDLDASDNTNDDKKFHWHGHHSTKRIIYGPHSPGGVMAAVSRHCHDISCDGSRFSVDSFKFGGISCPGVQNRIDGKLVVTPAGDGWTAKSKKYYMRAIQVISHLRSKHHTVQTGTQCALIRGQCTCSDYQKIDVHYGGKYFGINLVTKIHHRHISVGFIQALVRFQVTGLDACSLIVSAFQGIAGAGGPIGSIGGGFFGGYAEQAVCQNS